MHWKTAAIFRRSITREWPHNQRSEAIGRKREVVNWNTQVEKEHDGKLAASKFSIWVISWKVDAGEARERRRKLTVRVLSRIYRLGEKSRVADGLEFPRGVRGHATPEIFWNENALRCNLVHFETQFWEMCTDLDASGWFFRYSYLYTVMITIFLGGSWAFWGESFYPSNTLDRTLTV